MKCFNKRWRPRITTFHIGMIGGGFITFLFLAYVYCMWQWPYDRIDIIAPVQIVATIMTPVIVFLGTNEFQKLRERRKEIRDNRAGLRALKKRYQALSEGLFVKPR